MTFVVPIGPTDDCMLFYNYIVQILWVLIQILCHRATRAIHRVQQSPRHHKLEDNND